MSQYGIKITPLLMKGPLVLATLNGTKTVTRRTDGLDYVNESPDDWELATPLEWAQSLAENGCYGRTITDEEIEAKAVQLSRKGDAIFRHRESGQKIMLRSPYGGPGDLIWVREAWHFRQGGPVYDAAGGLMDSMDDELIFRADKPNNRNTKWRPSIHMPRWASRLTLEIADVRVERLKDITEVAARAEGITDGGCLNCGESEPCGCDDPQPDARDSFFHLWITLYGQDAVIHNPWLWVIEYRAINENIDKVLARNAAGGAQ